MGGWKGLAKAKGGGIYAKGFGFGCGKNKVP